MAYFVGGAPQQPEQPLRLQTRQRNEIRNDQRRDIDPSMRFGLEAIRKKYAWAKLPERATDTPIYNCHGMTFASRRTGIYDATEVKKILRDDEYTEVPERDVLPGDVVLYLDTNNNNDLTHSGVVVGVDRKIGAMVVVSKWGQGPEYVHDIRTCPYADGALLKFYRIVT